MIRCRSVVLSLNPLRIIFLAWKSKDLAFYWHLLVVNAWVSRLTSGLFFRSGRCLYTAAEAFFPRFGIRTCVSIVEGSGVMNDDGTYVVVVYTRLSWKVGGIKMHVVRK